MHIEILTKPADGVVVCLLTRQAVMDRVSIGKSKLYEMMRDGDFPKPHRIGVGMLRWRSDDVDAWISARAPASWSLGLERPL